MIRKAINTLSTKLSDGLSLSNSRLETLPLTRDMSGVCTMQSVRS